MKDSRAVSAIIEELKNLYPDASCSLDFDPDKAYELLFSVRLAAQCTDARVNLVTPILYAKYPTLEALAAATEEEGGEIIHSTGFWRISCRPAECWWRSTAAGCRIPWRTCCASPA